MLSDYDRAHFQEIVDGEGDWFSAYLIRLYAHSDQFNQARLAKAYPDVGEAYEAWYAATNPDLPEWAPPLDLDKVRAFLRDTANIVLDEEEDPNSPGEPYEMPNDDAWEAVHAVVREARKLLGEEPERPFVPEPMPGEEEEEK